MAGEQQQNQRGCATFFIASQMPAQRIMSERVPLQILCGSLQQSGVRANQNLCCHTRAESSSDQGQMLEATRWQSRLMGGKRFSCSGCSILHSFPLSIIADLTDSACRVCRQEFLKIGRRAKTVQHPVRHVHKLCSDMMCKRRIGRADAIWR